MEICEISFEDYSEFFHDSSVCYGTHEFNELNAAKCERIHYLCASNKKFKMGIVGGRKDGVFASPFSAPFCGFVFSGDHMHMNYVDEAISLFVDWVRNQGLSEIRIVLPPHIYDESAVSKVTSSLLRAGFIVDNVDLNYYYSLDVFDENLDSLMHYNARKHLKKALNLDLGFFQCQTEPEKELAYEIIRKNRAARGFPLKMSMDDVMNTSTVVKSDFFLVRDKFEVPVAAAVVFHVTERIVQVIYWGGLPEYNHLRSINYLAYRLFDFYRDAGKTIVDVGPSSEKSVPNYGLCDFKESLGCQVVSKMSFVQYLGVLCLGYMSQLSMLVDNLLLDMPLITLT
jgi:hypothetical protein